MSWTDHITSMLVSQENKGYCAITGIDGNIWAKSDGCPLAIPEAQALIAFAKAGGPVDPNKKYHYGNIKLMFLSKDEGSITVFRFATVNTPERPITDDEKALVAVAVSTQAAVFSFLAGPNQRKAADSCEREITHLKESGM